MQFMFLIRGALIVAVMNVARNSYGIAIPALPARHAIQKISVLLEAVGFIRTGNFPIQFFCRNENGHMMNPVKKNHTGDLKKNIFTDLIK